MNKKTKFLILMLGFTSIIFSTQIKPSKSYAQTETVKNTGPRKEIACGGVLESKHRMVCLSENTHSCTDSDCY